MMTNCVNCGAPASGNQVQGHALVCNYCGTSIWVLHPEADKIGFDHLYAMVKTHTFDDDKVDTIKRFVRKTSSRFTSGQTLAILRLFTFDDDRTEAAKRLVPRTIGLQGLLTAGGDLYTFSDDRNEFCDIVLEAARGQGKEALDLVGMGYAMAVSQAMMVTAQEPSPAEWKAAAEASRPRLAKIDVALRASVVLGLLAFCVWLCVG